MSPKSQALLLTVGTLASCVIAAIASILLFKFIPLNFIGFSILFAVMFYLFYQLYKMNLYQIEARNRLNQKVDK